jgi:cell wall-associated NlpC family hydrolase
MVTRAEIVACARSYDSVPYHHQGRIRAGLDCIGLAIAVCRDLDLGDFDFTAYSREPDGVTLIAEIEKICIPVQKYQTGDLLVFKIRRLPQHCGIVTDLMGEGLIHAYQSIGKVAEHALTDWWVERIVAAYRLPGVEP